MLSGKDLCLLRGDRCLFQNLNFALNSGELLLVEGKNGCGKTSLLRAIAGLLEFETGQVDWNGQSIMADHQVFCSDLVWLSHRVGFNFSNRLLIDSASHHLQGCHFAPCQQASNGVSPLHAC